MNEDDNFDIEDYELSKNNYPFYLNNNSDSLPKWQLSTEDEVESIKRSLLGVVKNPNVNPEDPQKWIRVMGAESVNDIGAIAIYNKFLSYLTKLTSDTKLDEDTIKLEVMYADNSFSEWLARNMERFNLSRKDYNIIVEQFVMMYKAGLYRSFGGWKGDLINQHPTTREVVYRDRDEGKKQGLSMPFNMFGGK